MTDHEKQERDAGLEAPVPKTAAAPDITRRKITKAALTTPLVMTLGPGSVLGTRAVVAASQGASVTAYPTEGAIFESEPDCASQDTTFESESARWLERREDILSAREGEATGAFGAVDCQPTALSTVPEKTKPVSRRDLSTKLQRR